MVTNTKDIIQRIPEVIKSQILSQYQNVMDRANMRLITTQTERKYKKLLSKEELENQLWRGKCSKDTQPIRRKNHLEYFNDSYFAPIIQRYWCPQHPSIPPFFTKKGANDLGCCAPPIIDDDNQESISRFIKWLSQYNGYAMIPSVVDPEGPYVREISFEDLFNLMLTTNLMNMNGFKIVFGFPLEGESLTYNRNNDQRLTLTDTNYNMGFKMIFDDNHNLPLSEIKFIDTDHGWIEGLDSFIFQISKLKNYNLPLVKSEVIKQWKDYGILNNPYLELVRSGFTIRQYPFNDLLSFMQDVLNIDFKIHLNDQQDQQNQESKEDDENEHIIINNVYNRLIDMLNELNVNLDEFDNLKFSRSSVRDKLTFIVYTLLHRHHHDH